MKLGCTKSLMRLGASVVALAVAGAAPASARVSAAADAGKHVLVVPTAYPTIQAAVDAANSGDKITILRGVFREQVSVGKDLTITDTGSHRTTIKAPGTLVPGEDGLRSIVGIHGDATVAMAHLAVSGPGPGTCEESPLHSGINVTPGSHLDLRRAKVTRPARTMFP